MKMELNKKLRPYRLGSALIMTMVLTVLLAIIAVMFVAVARMDRASTSNIADNKSLDLAAKSITEIICKDITKDIPGMTGYDPNKYCTYPDANHPWLASLEPYLYSNNGTPTDTSDDIYKWRQISDVNNFLKIRNFARRDVNISPIGLSTYDVVREYPEFKVDLNGRFLNQDNSLATNGISADADGDGIADSKWFELSNIQSSKGRKIYAAVRVIDNGGMVNVNTANSFDANISDGNSQMQINLKGLLKGTDTIDILQRTRCYPEPNDWISYQKNVIWDYNSFPGRNYLPFDISDELELRYRYCINSLFKSRFEDKMPTTVKIHSEQPGHLYNTIGTWGIDDWKIRITDPNFPKDSYVDRRHLLTAYNLDRIIDPCGVKMTNINDANVKDINSAIRKGLYNAGMIHSDANKAAAQIAVNIIDYRDTDPNVTVFRVDGKDYYGFESPCIYISELAYWQKTSPGPTYDRTFAIELYKPDGSDANPDNTWQIIVNGLSYSISNWTVPSRYYAVTWINPLAPIDINAGTQNQNTLNGSNIILNAGDTISLTRRVDVGGTPTDIVVDSVIVPVDWSLGSPAISDGNHSVQRDITPAKCIMRLWPTTETNPATLGRFNTSYASPNANTIQAHPKNGPFTNVGEIGMILRKPAYYNPAIVTDSNAGKIGYSGADKVESAVRLNLADANYQKLFKYLTVWPRSYSLGPNAEIKGRININTAPASVLAQLPWVSHRRNNYNDPNLAKAIVAYRDKQSLTATGGPDYRNRPDPCGFGNIGQLCKVNLGDPNHSIAYYSRKDSPKTAGDQIGPPDIDNTPLNSGDGAADDFEERDLIFTRISDLVTVRSDIFTAYILVRIGTDGPQKRYMVILDRSGVDAKKLATDPTNRVKIIAFQPVPQAK
ncbi:MAG: hypothetical protein ABR969_08255 [Sedimentisphaerales bacterium]